MTLYIDLILLENIIMNYIIILATGMICKITIKKRKIFLSSLLGALYAILICIINLEIYINSIIKILVSVCMIYVAFNPKNINILLKQLLIFYLISFCLGGVSYYLLCNINKSTSGVFKGFNTMKIIILGGFLGFFIINSSFKVVKNKLTKKDMLYKVSIFYKQRSSKINVLLDTGNLLKEPITKNPVLIVEAKKLKNIIPEYVLENIEELIYDNCFDGIDEDIRIRCSVIPFSSIGRSGGMMIGFRPDYIKIYTEEGEKIQKKVIVGIYNNNIEKNGRYSGLIGLNLLNEDCIVGGKYEYNSNVKN